MPTRFGSCVQTTRSSRPSCGPGAGPWRCGPTDPRRYRRLPHPAITRPAMGGVAATWRLGGCDGRHPRLFLRSWARRCVRTWSCRRRRRHRLSQLVGRFQESSGPVHNITTRVNLCFLLFFSCHLLPLVCPTEALAPYMHKRGPTGRPRLPADGQAQALSARSGGRRSHSQPSAG